LEEIEDNTADVTQKLQTLRGEARAARMLRDWTKLQQALDRWQHAFASEGRLPPAHGAMELLKYEAHYNSKLTYGSLPASISTCLTSQAAGLEHRLSAATLAMIRADNDGDCATACSIFEAVRELHPTSKRERVAWLTTNAIFHASFGDLTQTPGLLHQWAAEVLTIAQPACRAQHVRRACFGLARYGDPAYARQLLIQCLETFERLELTSQSSFCIEELGLLALWSGEYEEAAHWIDKAQEVQLAGGDSFCRAVEYELRVLLAFEAQNTVYLPTVEMPDEVTAALSRSKRGRQSVLTLSLAHRIVGSDGSDVESLVAQLLDLHLEMKSRGFQDQIVEVLVAAMTATGRSEAVNALLRDYVPSRREIRTLPKTLQQLVNSRCL
jgi:hypothetical protein